MSTSRKSIHDILLFHSYGSPYCDTVRNYVATINVPISFICIDSKAMRDRLSKINTLRVKGVPTLVVIYGSSSNGVNVLETAEIYEGDKVMSWLYANFGRMGDSNPHAPVDARSSMRQVENRDDRSRHTSSKKTSSIHPQTSYDERDRSYSKSKTQSKAKSKSKTHQTQHSQSQSTRPQESKRRKIDSVKALAKEMEEQRKKSLGIDDNGNTVKKRVEHEIVDQPQEDSDTYEYHDDDECVDEYSS